MREYKYILNDDKVPVVCDDLMKWGRWLEESYKNGKRRVAQTNIGKIRISTVFLGMDHSFSETAPPLIFETMIFGTDDDQELQWRYSTWDEALKGHQNAVAAVKKVRNRWYNRIKLRFFGE